MILAYENVLEQNMFKEKMILKEIAWIMLLSFPMILEMRFQSVSFLKMKYLRNDTMHDGLRDRDVGIASLGAGSETRTDPLLV